MIVDWARLWRTLRERYLPPWTASTARPIPGSAIDVSHQYQVDLNWNYSVRHIIYVKIEAINADIKLSNPKFLSRISDWS